MAAVVSVLVGLDGVRLVQGVVALAGPFVQDHNEHTTLLNTAALLGFCLACS